MLAQRSTSLPSRHARKPAGDGDGLARGRRAHEGPAVSATPGGAGGYQIALCNHFIERASGITARRAAIAWRVASGLAMPVPAVQRDQ